MPTLTELEEKRYAKSQALARVFDEAGDNYDMSQVKSLEGDSQGKLEQIRTMNRELDDIGKQIDEQKELEGIGRKARESQQQDREPASRPQQPSGNGNEQPTFKDIGKAFSESQAYKRKGDEAEVPDINLFQYLGGKAVAEAKALFETTAGWPPETTRNRPVVMPAEYEIAVSDLPMRRTTDQTALTYMEETTTTHNATEIAEGGTFPESAYALTQKTQPVQKVATWIPVTDEQLEDVSGIEQYLRSRLTRALNERVDGQLLNGSGVAPNLLGILNVSGIQTQAKGTDPTADAIFKAMTLLRVNAQARPDAVVMHPNDWEEIRLLRTSEGVYIWGNPTDAGPQRVWGRPVVVNEVMTEGTALVGDFGGFSEVAMKRGAEFQVTNAHSTYFIEGKQAIRLDARMVFVVYRPAAFATVTGI